MKLHSKDSRAIVVTKYLAKITNLFLQCIHAPSNALEKPFLNLDTRKSTGKWYQVEREQVARTSNIDLVIAESGPKNGAQTPTRCLSPSFAIIGNTKYRPRHLSEPSKVGGPGGLSPT